MLCFILVLFFYFFVVECLCLLYHFSYLGKLLMSNVFSISVIQEKQRKLTEEERDEVDGSSPLSSVSNPSSASVIIPNTDKLRAEKKKKRKARKARPQSAEQSSNPTLNLSAASEKNTQNFHVIEDNRAVRRANIQRSTTFDQGFSDPKPIERIDSRAVSASSIPVNHQQQQHTVPIIHHNGHNGAGGSTSEDEIRPTSVASTNASAATQGPPRSPANQAKAFSSSNINFEAYQIQDQHHHLNHQHQYQHQQHQQNLPPMRGTRVTSTLPRMVKSVSHHGQLRGAGATTNLDFPPLNRRVQQSSSDIQYIRRSQIFNIMKG